MLPIRAPTQGSPAATIAHPNAARSPAKNFHPTLKTCSLLAHHALTLPGLAVMAEGVASQGIGHLPMAVLPRLAPLCVTPPARIALIAATAAAPLVLRPLTHVVGTGVKDYFYARFVVAEQKALTKQLAGEHELCRSEGVARRTRNMVTSGHHELARNVATWLHEAIPFGITVGLAVVSFSTGMYASPVLVAVAIGMELLPLLIRILSQRPRQRVALEVAEADENFKNHMGRFWDKTVEGSDQSRETWQKAYEAHLQASCKARIKKDTVEQLYATAEAIPSSLNAIASAVPTYSAWMFDHTYELVKTPTWKKYQSIASAAHGLHSAALLATAFRDIRRSIAAQEHLQEDIVDVVKATEPQENTEASAPADPQSVVPMRDGDVRGVTGSFHAPQAEPQPNKGSRISRFKGACSDRMTKAATSLTSHSILAEFDHFVQPATL